MMTCRIPPGFMVRRAHSRPGMMVWEPMTVRAKSSSLSKAPPWGPLNLMNLYACCVLRVVSCFGYSFWLCNLRSFCRMNKF